MTNTAHGQAESTETLRGIGLFAAAVFGLSVMDVLIKLASERYPTGQIVFFRGLFAFLPLSILVWRSGGWRSLRTRRLPEHLLRGATLTTAAFAFFYALGQIPLIDLYAIAFAAPLFITALSVPMLGETVGPRRWAAVFVGFVGILIVLRPGQTGLDSFISLGAAAGLAGAFFYSVAMVWTRSLTRTDSTAAVVVYTTTVTTVASATTLPFAFVMPSAGDLLLLSAIGLCGGLSTVAMASAYRVAPAAVLAPFEYTSMIWAVLFGLSIWGDVPDIWVISGSTVVIASGLYILHRETVKRARQRSSARAEPIDTRGFDEPKGR